MSEPLSDAAIAELARLEREAQLLGGPDQVTLSLMRVAPRLLAEVIASRVEIAKLREENERLNREKQAMQDLTVSASAILAERLSR